MADIPDGRTPEGRFVKGKSGNPGGVNRALRRVRKALEKLDEPAMKRLQELIANDDPMLFLEGLKLWAKYRLPVPDSEARLIENRIISIERQVLEKAQAEAH